jgi:polygalacturonase
MSLVQSALLGLTIFARLIAVRSAVLSNQTTACTGAISSLDDVDDAVKCTTVNINSFTVPAGKQFNLDLTSGTTVNLSQ